MKNTEIKKEKGKIRKWMDEHAVELVVTAGGLILVGTGFWIGHNMGVISVKSKIWRNLPNLCDYLGEKGAQATMVMAKQHVPEADKLITDFLNKDPEHGTIVPELYYNMIDEDKISEMIFK